MCDKCDKCNNVLIARVKGVTHLSRCHAFALPIFDETPPGGFIKVRVSD